MFEKDNKVKVVCKVKLNFHVPQFCNTEVFICNFLMQHGAEVANNSTRITNNTLVPASLCAAAAIVCYGWTANYWTPPSCCPQRAELHHLPYLIK
jgi:hypothetical protein